MTVKISETMLNNINTFIGIDPGKGGAICIVKPGFIHVVNMPDSIHGISNYIDQFIEEGRTIACIEAVRLRPGDTGGKQFRIDKLLKNYTTLKTILSMKEIPFIEVGGMKWQRGLNIYKKDEEYEDRKRRLKEIAQKYFPDIKVTLKKADALLISLFIVTMYKNDRKFIVERIPRKKLELL